MKGLTPVSNLGPPSRTLGQSSLLTGPRIQGTSQEKKNPHTPKYSFKEIWCPHLVSTRSRVFYSNEMGFASIKPMLRSCKILLISDILFSCFSFVYKEMWGWQGFSSLNELGFSLLLHSLIFSLHFSKNASAVLLAFYSPHIFSLKTWF